MKHQRFFSLFVLALAATTLCGQEVKRTYAVRIEGRVVGHTTETEQPTTDEGREVLRIRSTTLVKVELLGAPIDQLVDQTWMVARDTRQPLRMQSLYEVGPQKVQLKAKLTDAGWEFDDGRKPLDPEQVVLAPDLRWLKQRGAKKVGEVVEVDMLVPEVGSVHTVKVSLADKPERVLTVMGNKMPVRVYLLSIPGLGIESVVFVHPDSYELVRYEIPAQKVVMDRCSQTVIERIQRIDLTNQILVKTNLNVEDPSILTFVRLHAAIETTKDVTVESLNVPGQVFEGTVENGHIVGEFTIRSHHCDASKTPSFPVAEGTFAAPHLKEYLAPSENIESDDPALSSKARELAKGALSCYVVLDRLAKWTHDEIPYVIPGGGTAKRTFALRQGECGGHARVLAAMLRAVGIPARTPMGGMYVPLYGGSFGQHMWTEVWLGDAIGWLPVDCTAGQSTFLDAGHIRLSDTITKFSPNKIRVLDHAPKEAKVEGAKRRTDAFPYAVDKPFVYGWTLGGKDLGDETVTYRGKKDGAHLFEGVVNLSDGRFKETTRTRVGDDGRLQDFHCDRVTGNAEEAINVALVDGAATIKKKSAETDKSGTIDVDPAMFVLHNNCTTHFMLAVNRVGPFAEGGEYSARLLHTENQSVLTMNMTAKGLEEITIGGAKVKARAIDVKLIDLTILIHVDEQGRVLRYHQKRGDVTIELKSL